MQGMGWTCLEELVWGDEQHKWLPPGVLHTRGPGESPCSFLLVLYQSWCICNVAYFGKGHLAKAGRTCPFLGDWKLALFENESLLMCYLHVSVEIISGGSCSLSDE